MPSSSTEPREISEYAIRVALQRDGFSVYPGAVLPARQVPPDFVPINVDGLPEIEEYHSDEPPRMLRLDEMDEWGSALRRPQSQVRAPKKKLCLGARPRASRGRATRRRGSRRTSAPTRAGPGGEPPGDGDESSDEADHPLLHPLAEDGQAGGRR
jgi:hypothetical protein